MLPIKGKPFGPGGYGAFFRILDAKFSSRTKVSGKSNNRVV
jgi:ribonuclease HI